MIVCVVFTESKEYKEEKKNSKNL